jgi:hypothetical protein
MFKKSEAQELTCLIFAIFISNIKQFDQQFSSHLFFSSHLDYWSRRKFIPGSPQVPLKAVTVHWWRNMSFLIPIKISRQYSRSTDVETSFKLEK